MEFAFDARTEDLHESLFDFMGSHVYRPSRSFTRSSAGSRTSGPGTRYR